MYLYAHLNNYNSGLKLDLPGAQCMYSNCKLVTHVHAQTCSNYMYCYVMVQLIKV